MYLIDFFVPNSNTMSASLESLSIFVYSRSKVNFKIKYDFSTNELGTIVIPDFHVILTGQSISKIILIIQGYLQYQKVNFKVK